MKHVAFVSGLKFSNFDLLSRACAVALETLIGDEQYLFEAQDNSKLEGLLIQWADSTRKMLGNNGITITPGNCKDMNCRGYDLVIVLGELNYWPYKKFVMDARDAGIEILEY